MNGYLDTLKEKSVLVVGLGRSGRASIEALAGKVKRLALQDSKEERDISDEDMKFLKDKGVECHFAHVPEDVIDFDMLVLSPGVPPAVAFVQEAKNAGAEIIGELELAYRCGSGHFIAITGTNGKTTTTTLVGEILANAGRDTRVVGNIGNPVVTEALNSTEDTWMVTETSSFQLETIKDFKPQVSAILNLTPDHMDRHKTMENYGKAKARIMENQSEGDYVVINFDDKQSLALISGTKAKVVPFSRLEPLKFGAFVKDDRIVVINEEENLVDICGKDELLIPGSHNLENALAAVAMAYFAGVSVEIIAKTLREFGGVEHRLEPSGEINGVKFVNDSKGTNTDAAIKAIEAVDGPIVLIAGGYDKNADYGDFIDSFGDKVKQVVMMGATAGKIKAAAEKKGYQNTIIVKDMEACVREAFRVAEPGDTVLLSPACASWDMYNSFEERGRDFKECVNKLKDEER
ncbi:UDP-N-acetylmuramoyl-L-alanine--D-glutamate ligase [Gallibacter intestinalis]|uniref:UDP-N-acetylmuramoylalanine--D-glutamate ligase n=1 Tax=Gallibacter intestinalis TaxID=2779356 RepID=A0ABR9QY60_9FIRM|nr:UDP-N-acetylmuramoyl-L-alanine--D-glutamate ligase [Gallibacter intestinalis]MBE5035791.1 UDP-N-acetylmuramoyl-L-alanine--D-glutamate ligase [Gallibacter intestinalis]